uniref:Uncharacterized protein LOC117347950 isoform X2 n=1 Tax=Geotrypetes seraphini TaxID=260995 RepID=A0A6P8NW79_GEOSA|nr:uncharacterized protein LOC117347950 isoform X2 [Geotrypetes seraphini]
MEPIVASCHRGDEPALAVIAAHMHSRMARRAEETKEEMEAIRKRVDQMIQVFEQTSLIVEGQQPGMEIIDDVDQLNSILSDKAKRKKYNQQLTVFIVGYQETCGKRKTILSQLQEFFTYYAKLEEESITQTEDFHMEMDNVAVQVKAAVSSAEAAMSRLLELHKELISYVNNAMTPTSAGKRKPLNDKSRKKMEKAIEQAKEDIAQLTIKLLQAQKDLDSKDKKLKELLRQNEMKGLESQHLQDQLQSTKNLLATYQQEYDMQRSLQEAEGKWQASRIAELEEILTEKEELKRETATQWSDLSPPSTTVSEWEIDSMAGEAESDGGGGDDSDRRQHEELEGPGLREELRGDGMFSEQDVHRCDTSPTRLCSPNFPTSRPVTPLSYTPPSDQDSSEMMVLLSEQDSSLEELQLIRLSDLSLGSTPSPSLQLQIQHDSGQEEANEEMEMPPSCEGSFGSADLSQEHKGGAALTPQEGEPLITERTTPADVEQEADLHVSDTVTATEQDSKSSCVKETTERSIQDTCQKADSLLLAELAAVKEESHESIARLKKHIRELEAQGELEKQELLQQIQNLMRAQAVAERKAAFALEELQKLYYMHKEMPSTAECEVRDSSEIIPIPSTNEGIHISISQLEDRPHPKTGAPEGPCVTPENGTNQHHGGFSKMPLVEGLQEISKGITAFLGSIRNGVMNQGLYSLAELLDGSFAAVPEVILASPEGISRTEIAQSLQLLSNAAAVFNRLLEEITYKNGVPPKLEEVMTENAGVEMQATASHTGALSQDQNEKVEQSSFWAPLVTREQKRREKNELRSALKLGPHITDRPPGILFTYLDEKHNRRVLEQGVSTGRVPRDLYQTFQRWKKERLQDSQNRLKLAVSLEDKLRQIEGQSGIFLIKPLLSWPERCPQLHSERINARLKGSPVTHTVSTHPHSTQEVSNLWAGSSMYVSGTSFLINTLTNGEHHREWNSESADARDTSAEINQKETPQPMVITPQLLVMDVNRYLIKECRVSAITQSRSSSPYSKLQPSGSAALRNFLPVTRTSGFNLSCSGH